jgi:hypothetical protein
MKSVVSSGDLKVELWVDSTVFQMAGYLVEKKVELLADLKVV